MVFELIIAVVVGFFAGILVNVLADDLPLRRKVRLPRYVSEAKKRAVHVPVLNEAGEDMTHDFLQEDDPRRPMIAWSGTAAFLFAKRSAPDGSVKLGWRYPLTDIMTVAFFSLAVLASHQIDVQEAEFSFLQLLFWFYYMTIFALIIVIDVEHYLILFIVIIPSVLVAVVDALITAYEPSLQEALSGGLLGFGIFFVLYGGGFVFTYIMGALRGKRIDEVAFGYGDVMMATLSGVILGWRVLIFAMFIAVFLGAFGAIAFVLLRALLGKKYNAFTALPYGPYIVLGTIAMLLFGKTLGPAMFGAVFPP